MQWGQALGLECFAFRPVGGLQVRELLFRKRFVVRRQRVQAGLLAGSWIVSFGGLLISSTAHCSQSMVSH